MSPGTARHRRRLRAALAVLAATAVLGAAACSSGDDPGDGAGSDVDLSVLGETDPATGSAVKIGLITDGRTEAADHSDVIAAFDATIAYANEHLGGLNGHVIEVDHCDTKFTPAGATACGVQMARDGVAAALVVASAHDGTIFAALEGSGIPYVTYAAANREILLSPGAFILTNPLAAIAAPAKLAKDKGLGQVGFILIDVPAATGPITTIATPIFAKAGATLNMVTISPQTADMTPQIQQALQSGDRLFTITGTDDFAANAIKTLHQLGYDGDIILMTPPTAALNDAVPGGLTGVINNTPLTSSPDNADVKLFHAVLAKYATDIELSSLTPWTFTLALGFVRALTGATDAVDAASVAAALGSMPAPVPLPMGDGIELQCGAELVSFAPNVCSANILTTTLDASGKGTSFELLDVSEYLTLG